MENLKRNKKFQQIVITAKELFWKYGIRRVSIEEICTEAPVSKMTFYKFFKNKELLAEYILKEVFAQSSKEYREIMEEDIPFPSKIKRLIEFKNAASVDMSEEFISDIYNNEYPLLQQLFADQLKIGNVEFLRDMTIAQEKGEIRQDIKPEFILYILDDIRVKIMDENLSALYNSKHELMMELINYFFYGVISTKD